MSEMRGVIDTQKSNFWKESLKKEAHLRQEWYLRYSKEFVKSQGPPKRRAPATIDFTPVVVPDKQPSPLPVKPATAPPQLSTGQSSDIIIGMRPATINTHRLLYQGISHHGEGRFRYLSARKTVNPEHKFTHPLTNSMDYGWKIKERITPRRSEFARKFIIKNSFFRPAGIVIGPT